MSNFGKILRREVSAELLNAYGSIEFTIADPKQMQGKTWRRILREHVDITAFFDNAWIDRAVERLMQDDHIHENYLSPAISSELSEALILLKHENPSDVQSSIRRIIDDVLTREPVGMRVCMPVYGIALFDELKLGSFTFVPPSAFDRFTLHGLTKEMVAAIKEQMWGDIPHVFVTIQACDANKAKEKAREEFKWLESALRLFRHNRYDDIGIINFECSRVENALVFREDGLACSVSSQLVGSIVNSDLKKILSELVHLCNVVEVLGRPNAQLTPIQRAMRHAVYLGGMAAHETEPSIAYFLAVSALEALFHAEDNGYVSPSIAQQIIEAYCFLIADEKERRTAFDVMRPFYRRRSSVAHGSSFDGNGRDKSVVLGFLRHSIVKMLSDPELVKLRTPAEFAERVRERKFGVAQPVNAGDACCHEI